jgi:hypothetical protein
VYQEGYHSTPTRQHHAKDCDVRRAPAPRALLFGDSGGCKKEATGLGVSKFEIPWGSDPDVTVGRAYVGQRPPSLPEDAPPAVTVSNRLSVERISGDGIGMSILLEKCLPTGESACPRSYTIASAAKSYQPLMSARSGPSKGGGRQLQVISRWGTSLALEATNSRDCARDTHPNPHASALAPHSLVRALDRDKFTYPHRISSPSSNPY